MSRKKSKKRRRRRSRIFTKILALIAVLALLIGGFFSVFQLQSLIVTGNTHVSADEVMSIALSRPTAGNTVLTRLMNTKRTISGTGFVERLDAEIEDRSTVTITVTEHRFVGVLESGGSYWYLLSDGTVQANAKERAASEEIPLVEGLELNTAIQLGSVLPIQGTRPFVLLDSLKGMFELHDITPEKVVFASDGTVSLIYGEVTVLIGDGTNLEKRMEALAGILEEMDDSYSGTLHLESYDQSKNAIVFDPN